MSTNIQSSPAVKMSFPVGMFTNSYLFGQSAKNFMLAAGFFFGITVIRYLFRANKRSEFDYYPHDKVIEICKFCQIIKDQQCNLYNDEDVMAFSDGGPLAKQHLLIVPHKHIRHINTIESTPESLALLKKMQKVALDLLKQIHLKEFEKQQALSDKPLEFKEGQYLLGFHRSFAISVDHLHMHAFELPFKSTFIYWRKTCWIFFMKIEDLISYIEKQIERQLQRKVTF
ncbi:histidine triad family protein [Stylonychia lemnae]|uniref:Histidine triad family protein n=1 Tax=Stylonychia lemnae TaxID=5949 RepID=A0A078B3P1_STYLE|nr:histidine triad family protein [Stylonychia lemnae]|eukprot:CDW89074.1 histidine triad family protein [Stylonychia lemnae]